MLRFRRGPPVDSRVLASALVSMLREEGKIGGFWVVIDLIADDEEEDEIEARKGSRGPPVVQYRSRSIIEFGEFDLGFRCQKYPLQSHYQ